MTDEEQYTDEELAEGQLLAQRLASAARTNTPAALQGAPVLDALETADFILSSRSPELAEARVKAVLADAQMRVQKRRSYQRRRRFAVGSAALLASAAAILVWLSPTAHAPAPTRPPAGSVPAAANRTPLDETRMGLAAAQREWLIDRRLATKSHLQSQLAKYRAAHLNALAARYAP